MKRKELIGKLTPDYFEKGKSFDTTVFASLVDALQKHSTRRWADLIFIVALGIAAILQFGIGGYIGNFSSVICLFLAVFIVFLLTNKIKRQIKSSRQALGINQKEIKQAIQKLKEENKYIATARVAWFYTALSLSFILAYGLDLLKVRPL